MTKKWLALLALMSISCGDGVERAWHGYCFPSDIVAGRMDELINIKVEKKEIEQGVAGYKIGGYSGFTMVSIYQNPADQKEVSHAVLSIYPGYPDFKSNREPFYDRPSVNEVSLNGTVWALVSFAEVDGKVSESKPTLIAQCYEIRGGVFSETCRFNMYYSGRRYEFALTDSNIKMYDEIGVRIRQLLEAYRCLSR